MLSTCLQFVTLFRGLSTTLVLYLGLGTVYLGVSFFFFLWLVLEPESLWHWLS